MFGWKSGNVFQFWKCIIDGLHLHFHVYVRTLLALGCHVGVADEHAVEKVKKLKLPSK